MKRDYRRTTSVTGLLDELGWQTLVERRRFSRLSLFYKALHGQAGLGVDRLRLSQGATRASSGGDVLSAHTVGAFGNSDLLYCI